MTYTMDDKGNRHEFKSGAVRESEPNKGRYELVSPIFLRRLSIVLEKGANKYSDRNWEQGMPLGRYAQAAIRHIYQYIEGMRDEDHLGQAAFNIMALIHTEEQINRGLLPKELDNLPNYIPKGDHNDHNDNAEKG